MPLKSAARALLQSWRSSNAIKRGRNAPLKWQTISDNENKVPASNPLREFFDGRKEGAGIWKWNHYFDIYDRHFRRFRGTDVRVLEIGVYSGGSLEMWRDYFGPQAFICGADIEPACRAYEINGTKIFIGDQEDRSFWRDVRDEVGTLDIVIDDGGHQPEQQIVSLEELLPFLRAGGVYICEDVHGAYNQFASYIHGLIHKLNAASTINRPDDDELGLISPTNSFQSAIASIHLYPFVIVLERNSSKITELRCPKHGTQWQPFLR